MIVFYLGLAVGLFTGAMCGAMGAEVYLRHEREGSNE